MKITKPLVLFIVLFLSVLAGKAQGSIDFCQIEKIATQEAKKWNYDPSNSSILIERSKHPEYLKHTYSILFGDKEFRSLLLDEKSVLVVFSAIQIPGRFVEDGSFYIFLNKTNGSVLAAFNGRLAKLAP